MKKQTKEKKVRKNEAGRIKKRVKKSEKKKSERKAEVAVKNRYKDSTKLKFTEKKIKSLLDVEHLEELLHIMHILKNEDIEIFIKHYKKSKIKSRDEKIDKIIKNCKNSHDLLDSLKKELIEELYNEYENLRKEISDKRKIGCDVYIEDVNSMSIPLKIKMFDATSERKDYYKVRKLIKDIKDKLNLKKSKETI